MDRMTEIVEGLAEALELEVVEHIGDNQNGLLFVGINEEDEESEITVTDTNHVIIDGEISEIDLPIATAV